MFISLSCKRKTENKEVEITMINGVKLTSKKNMTGIDLFRPCRLFVFKDKIVVFDDTRNGVFKVFDSNSLTYKYSFGQYGQGPNEFVFIDKEAINTSRYFEILDRNKLLYYQIGDSSALPIDSVSYITNSKSTINNFKKISDSIYVFTNNGDLGSWLSEFTLFNVVSKNKSEFGKPVLFDNELKNRNIQEQSMALIKSIAVNRNKKRIAAFYYRFPYFRIMENNSENRLFHINAANLDDKDCIYFTEPYATNKYIYVMWISKSKKGVMAGISNYRPSILVFDWDGNLRNRFLLDIPAITFAISEDDSRLYAVSFDENDLNAIYTYDLPVLQNNNDAHTHLRNKYFSIDVLKGYHIIENMEKSDFSEYQENGYAVKHFAMGQGLRPQYSGLGSINIKLYTPLNKEKGGKGRLAELISYLKRGSFNFGLNNNTSSGVTHCSYSIKGVDYYGKENISYYNSFLFNEKNTVIEISVNSTTQNIGKYLEGIKIMASSFKLNE